jgi:hypothetical protein
MRISTSRRHLEAWWSKSPEALTSELSRAGYGRMCHVARPNAPGGRRGPVQKSSELRIGLEAIVVHATKPIAHHFVCAYQRFANDSLRRQSVAENNIMGQRCQIAELVRMLCYYEEIPIHVASPSSPRLPYDIGRA